MLDNFNIAVSFCTTRGIRNFEHAYCANSRACEKTVLNITPAARMAMQTPISVIFFMTTIRCALMFGRIHKIAEQEYEACREMHNRYANSFNFACDG
jgi:hypothetical protein